MVGEAPLGAIAQGQTHHWRAVGLAIPWRDARPQSPPPFRPAAAIYRNAARQARASGPARHPANVSRSRRPDEL